MLFSLALLSILGFGRAGAHPLMEPGFAFPHALKIVGNESSWTLAINGQDVVWSTRHGAVEQLTTATRRVSNQELVLDAILNGKPLRIAIAHVPCSHRPSGRTYRFSASVTFGGATMSGCADEPKVLGEDWGPPTLIR